MHIPENPFRNKKEDAKKSILDLWRKKEENKDVTEDAFTQALQEAEEVAKKNKEEYEEKNKTYEWDGREVRKDVYECLQSIEGLGLDIDEVVTFDDDGQIKHLDLRSLTNAEGLQLPETIGESLNLGGLKSTEGLQLPQAIGKSLYLNDLTSAEGVELPETIDGNLVLISLTSAKGLQLPKTIGRNLYLISLTSAEGLELPETVAGKIHLDSLPNNEKYELREKYHNLDI